MIFDRQNEKWEQCRLRKSSRLNKNKNMLEQYEIIKSFILNNKIYFILSTVLVLILSSLFSSNKNHNRNRKILFIGPNNSGKTSQLLNLLKGNDNSDIITKTSTKINQIQYNDRVLFDIPGHSKISKGLVKSHLNNTCRIVYFIDFKQIKNSSQHFYEVYRVIKNAEKLKDFIILLNKFDQPTSLNESLIINRSKNLLEFELNNIRLSNINNKANDDDDDGNPEISLADIQFYTNSLNDNNNLLNLLQ